MTMRLIPRLSRDRRGVSAVEFALFAPILGLLVMGMSDLARGLARKFEIEQASYRALELVTVGTIQSDYAYVKPEAAAAAGVPEANVQVDAWLECDGTLKEPFSETCSTGQQTARFVKVSIWDDFQPSFAYGPIGTAFGGNENGFIRVRARSTLRVQ